MNDDDLREFNYRLGNNLDRYNCLDWENDVEIYNNDNSIHFFFKEKKNSKNPTMESINIMKELNELPEEIKELYYTYIKIAGQNYFSAKKKMVINLTTQELFLEKSSIFVDYLKQDEIIWIFSERKIEEPEKEIKKIETEFPDIKKENKHDFSLNHRNDKFKIFNALFSLTENFRFLAEIEKQILLKKKIEDEIEKRKIKNDMNEMIFRFGGVFKDLFFGLDFDFVLKVVNLILLIKIKKIQFFIENENIIINFEETHSDRDENQIFIFEQIYDLICGYKNFNSDSFLSKLLKKEFFNKRVEDVFKKDNFTQKIFIKKADLEEIFKNELKYFYLKNKKKNIPFEEIDELFIIWILINMLDKNYTTLVSVFDHYNKSNFELLGLMLNVDFRKIDETSSLFLINTKEIYNTIIEPADNLVRAHKQLSLKKKFFEIKQDFFCLISLFRLHRREILNEEEFFKEIKKIEIEQSEGDFKEIVNLENMKTSNNFFWNLSKNLINKFCNFELKIEFAKIIDNFLNSRKNILLIKQISQDKVVLKIDKLNKDFLEKTKIGKYFDIEKIPDFKRYFESISNEERKRMFGTINYRKEYLKKSEGTKRGLVQMLEKEQEILKKVVCFENLKKNWLEVKKKIDELIESHKENGQNKEVERELRFEYDKRRFKLPDKTREETKNLRRLKPELFIPLESFLKINPLIRQMHWKVQNGLIFWFFTFIENTTVCQDVLKIFNQLRIKEINSRKTAVAYFGIFSKFYKFVKHCFYLKNFEEFRDNQENAFLKSALKIRPDLMIDLDCCFGLSETDKKEDNLWDKEFVEHLHEWMNRDTREIFLGLDLTEDFSLALESFLKDTTATTSFNAKQQKTKIFVFVEQSFFFNVLPDMIKKKDLETFKDSPSFYFANTYKNPFNFFYDTFQKKTNNFFNFGAHGSAQRFRLETKKTKDLEDLKDVDEENYVKIAQKIKNQDSKKGGSKTICFSYTGEALIKIFYWVYGKEYTPQLSLCLKKEPKKIRHVINSDLVSFVKQTYFHDWVVKTLNPFVKEKINSILTPRERVIFYKRSAFTARSEKWCVEMDLKDFHHHFGSSHYKAIYKVFLHLIKRSIHCDFIYRDMELIIKSFKEELARGEVCFRFSSDSPDEQDLFKKYMQNLSNCSFLVNYKEQTINKENKTPENVKKKKAIYNLNFAANNGLMSGWKLTSLFGSLFNITLNKMCELFTLFETGDIVGNLNVMGDDTHLKERYLSASLNHINFVNSINKIAHPEKQLISTVILEFLKKKINTLTEKTEFSNLTSVTTILYKKKDKQTNKIDNNYIKDVIDLFNLFLCRLSDEKTRQFVLQKKIFYYLFQNVANFSNSNKHLEETKKLINSPVFYSGAVAGYLRTNIYDFDKRNFIKNDIMSFNVYPQLKILEFNVNPGQCKGIRTNINKIVGNFNFCNKGFADRLRQQLIAGEFEEIFEKKAEYFKYRSESDKNMNPKNEFIKFMNFEQIQENIKENKIYQENKYNYINFEENKKSYEIDRKSEKEQTLFLIEKNNDIFDIEKFIEFAFQMIEKAVIYNIKFSGIIGELIYHNEKISKSIYQNLKHSYLKERGMYQMFINLKKLRKDSVLDNNLRKQFVNIFGDKIFFSLALSEKLKISVSSCFMFDEIRGFINDEFSKYLIFYIIDQSKLNKKNFNDYFKNIVISLDYYIHQNCDALKERFEKILLSKIKNEVDL